jgi:hypothetical protein
MINYKEINGTGYHAETSDNIVEILEGLRKKHALVRIFYGDAQTGRAWQVEHDTVGRIGRSGGSIKLPLLVPANEIGGGAILDPCIVKIIELTPTYKTRSIAYSHPTFNQHHYTAQTMSAPLITEIRAYGFEVLADGEAYSLHSSKAGSEALVKFMNADCHIIEEQD